MSSLSTEKAEVLLEAVLLLLLSEFAIFTELHGEVRVRLLQVSIATARVSITRVTRVALSARVVFIFVSIGSSVVICIALSLTIRAVILVGSQILSGNLRTVFPITEVDRMGEGVEFGESIRFADVGDFVLDSG